MATIKEGLKYPFTNFKRLFNYYWLLIPVWGWFILCGYSIKIINEVRKGNIKGLPPIRPFKGLFKLGFFVAVLSLAYIIVMQIFLMINYIGWIGYLYLMLILPIAFIQFAETKNLRDGFDVVRATKTVFNNFGKYIIMYLKMIAAGLVLLVASIPIITLIVTLPAMGFMQYLFITDFYVEVMGKKKKVNPAAKTTRVIKVKKIVKKKGKK